MIIIIIGTDGIIILTSSYTQRLLRRLILNFQGVWFFLNVCLIYSHFMSVAGPASRLSNICFFYFFSRNWTWVLLRAAKCPAKMTQFLVHLTASHGLVRCRHKFLDTELLPEQKGRLHQENPFCLFALFPSSSRNFLTETQIWCLEAAKDKPSNELPHAKNGREEREKESGSLMALWTGCTSLGLLVR